MYPVLRQFLTVRRARRRPPLSLDETGVLDLRCWPFDLDTFAEMNNGRVLTLCDLGRFDHFVRSGVVATARREGWGFAVGGASVRYRRRIRAFERVRLLTRPIGRDDRWFYVHQAMIVGGEPASSVLIRSCCADRRGIVATDRVMAALGRPDWRPPLPLWVDAWSEAEARRPWPPEFPDAARAPR